MRAEGGSGPSLCVNSILVSVLGFLKPIKRRGDLEEADLVLEEILGGGDPTTIKFPHPYVSYQLHSI